jgi:molecular chaperone GrpE
MTGDSNSDLPEGQQGSATDPAQAAQQGEAAAAGLEVRVAELEAQVADLTDRLLRAHAEMENVRKRTEREKLETAKYAISKFAQDMVAVFDNFERAVAAVPAGAAEQDPALKSLIEGVTMTERAALQMLAAHGVKRIDAQGEVFNPHLHQAVMEQDMPELPAGTVLQVLQAGYVIEERVLRPAMVVTAKGGPKPARPAEAPAAAANDDGPMAAATDAQREDPKLNERG